MKTRTTTVKFRDWPWHQRVIEKLYRLTHGGQIRTLVVTDQDREWMDAWTKAWKLAHEDPGNEDDD